MAPGRWQELPARSLPARRSPGACCPFLCLTFFKMNGFRSILDLLERDEGSASGLSPARGSRGVSRRSLVLASPLRAPPSLPSWSPVPDTRHLPGAPQTPPPASPSSVGGAGPAATRVTGAGVPGAAGPVGRQRSPGEPGAGGQACVAGLRRRPLSAVGWLRAGRPPGAGASPAETPAWRSGRADRTGASGCKPAHAASHSGRGARRRRRQAGGREPARVRWQGQSGPKPRGRRSPKAQRQEVRPQGRCGAPACVATRCRDWGGGRPNPSFALSPGSGRGRVGPRYLAASGRPNANSGRQCPQALAPEAPARTPDQGCRRSWAAPVQSHAAVQPAARRAACRSRSSAGRQRSRARGRHGLGHLPGAPQPHRGVRGVPCTRSPGARG